jgi:hypothetical protein
MRDFENTDEEDILGDLPGMTARSGELLGVVEGIDLMIRSIVATCVAALGLSILVSPAEGSPVPISGVVSDNPADFTPRITVGNAPFAAVPIGDNMYVGGAFSEVKNASRSVTLARKNLYSFHMGTGAINPLSITVDGDVLALATDGTSLYVGGKFFNVNGVARRGLAKINPATGAVDTAFNAKLTGIVQDLEVANGRLIVAGKFSKRLTAVNLATGADLNYINLSITGTTSDTAGATDVWRFGISPDKSKLVAVGNFTAVNGQTRWRAFMVNLGSTSASLAPWYYPHLSKSCGASTKRPAYLRDVDFSPDGAGFFIVSTGGGPLTGDRGLTVCDAAARFNTATASPTKPAWITYANGDTLLSTVATASAVYVQGHQKSLGPETHEGIGAINPNTGAVLSWDPWKQRGFGGQVLVVTGPESPRQGLWVGSDTTQIGGGTSPTGGPAGTPEVHERWAFFPTT